MHHGSSHYNITIRLNTEFDDTSNAEASAVCSRGKHWDQCPCVATPHYLTQSHYHTHTSVYGLKVCGLHSAAPKSLWSLQQTLHSSTTTHRKLPVTVTMPTPETFEHPPQSFYWPVSVCASSAYKILCACVLLKTIQG